MSTIGACFLIIVCLSPLTAAPVPTGKPRTDNYGDPLPSGAVGRLGTIRLRQVIRDGSGAGGIAFSPDGKTVVSCGQSGLRAWDVMTGKDLGWFPTPAPATSVRFAPDGKTLLTCDNNGSIRVWEAGTGKLLRETNPPPQRGIPSFHGASSFLSANGKIAGVNGLGNDGVRLWDTETGKQILDRKGTGQNLVLSAALSPDGKTLVVSGERNLAHLLEMPTFKEVRLIEGPNKAPHLAPGYIRQKAESVYWFVFSPDGKTLAGMSGMNSVSVWNVADGQLRYTIREGHGRLIFSPDGKHLVCGGEGAIHVYDSANGKEVRQFDPHSGYVYALGYSPDGKTLATAHEYHVEFWDVATGKRLRPTEGHRTPVVSLAFAPDGNGLASGDSSEGLLIVWDLKTRKPRLTLRGHYPEVISVAYSPDGKMLASGDGHQGTGGRDARIRLWDLSTGDLVRQFSGHLNSVESLTFSPDSKRLVSGGHDARTRVWDATTGKRLLQIRGGDTRHKSVAISPDGKTLLVGASPGELALWWLDTGEKIRDLGPPGDESRSIPYAAFLSGGRTVVTREHGDDRSKFDEVRFWDAENGRLLRSFSLGAFDGISGLAAVAPDGNTIAIGGGFRDPVIRVWDTATGKQVGRFSGHQSEVAALAFSPDSKTLASGSRDATVLLWDVARARLEHLWAELHGGQVEGTRTVKGLSATAEESVPHLRDRLRRAAEVEDRSRRLIADLDAEKFAVRDRASSELESLGPEAAPYLRLALGSDPSLEARQRLLQALNKVKASPAEHDSQTRNLSVSLAILEELGTPDARKVLEELAKGPAQSAVTREAGAALERLAKLRTKP